jgi:hypothetical protein
VQTNADVDVQVQVRRRLFRSTTLSDLNARLPRLLAACSSIHPRLSAYLARNILVPQ